MPAHDPRGGPAMPSRVALPPTRPGATDANEPGAQAPGSFAFWSGTGQVPLGDRLGDQVHLGFDAGDLGNRVHGEALVRGDLTCSIEDRAKHGIVGAHGEAGAHGRGNGPVDVILRMAKAVD